MALINTTTTGVLGSTFFGDGTGDLTIQQNGVTINKITAAPTFSAYQSSGGQSISNSTVTKVTFDVEEWDTANCFDNTTNYRFTPNVAGYYLIKGGSVFNLASSVCNVWLFKTGVQTVIGSQIVNNTSVVVATLNEIIYLNGSTDYVELYGSQFGGATSNNYALGSFVTFQGFLARSA
jgi:hypothetical protein